MKILLGKITILILCFWQEAKTQHFELPIYLEDTAGFKDTVVVGYDINASYGMDSSFGELNILDSPYMEPFEARAAIYDYNEWPQLPRIFESKKMIIGYVCTDPGYSGESGSIMLVIKSQNWPVTLTWDNTLFLETCDRLDIVDCTPGGWFDVCGPGHPHQILYMQHTDTASYFSSEFSIITAEDTLQALFLRFHKLVSGHSDVSFEQPMIYPNPNDGGFYLNSPHHVIEEFRIYNTTGQEIEINFTKNRISLENVPPGVYIIVLKLPSGELATDKILKIDN